MNMYRWLLVIVVALGATGCASLMGEERYWLKPGQSASDDAVSLLYYAHYVRELGVAERERELARQQAAFTKDKSAFRRMQYALGLLAGTPGMSERRLAHQTLEPLLEGQGGSVAALAELLEAQLQGLRRADELEKKLAAMRDIERSLLQRDRSRP